jgi:hypothetical protein
MTQDIESVIAWAADAANDWNGGPMADAEESRVPISCGTLRALIAHIRDLEGRNAALEAMLAAQLVQPYRGWNLTALNKAADHARELCGMPSIRELNPDIAAMQDAAEKNREAIAGITKAIGRTGEEGDGS